MEVKGFRIGRYQVLSRLGMGGMGEVWLAVRDDAPDAPLVVKTVLPHLADDARFAALFLKEARIAASISSPRVVSILDLGNSEGTLYLVLEYVDGLSLETLLTRKAPLPPSLAAFIASEVCAALEDITGQKDAHGRPMGVVHRDISPGNILLSRDGTVKVSDFGIAKTASTDPGLATTIGVAKGKGVYMSPEQALGADVDARTDLFAVGVVLYRMLSGEVPYEFQSELELLLQITSGRRTPLAKRAGVMPPALVRIVERALQQEVDERFPNAQQMRAALDASLAQARATRSQAELGALVNEVAGLGWRRSREGPITDPVRAAEVLDVEATHPEQVLPGGRASAALRWGVGVLALVAVAGARGAWWLHHAPVSPPALQQQNAVRPLAQQNAVVTVGGGDEPPPRSPGSPAEAIVTSNLPPVIRRSGGRGLRAVRVETVPPCMVRWDGRMLGTSPVEIKMRGTRARLNFYSRELGIDVDREFEVPPAETSRTVLLAHGKLNVRVDPWAEVTLDGRPLGLTPLPVMDVFAGKHQLVLVNTELNVQKQLEVEVIAEQTAVFRVKLP